MVCPPARNLVSPCLPLSPHICACVDGASASPRSCLPCGLPLSLIVCLFLSPIVTPHVCPLDAVSAFSRSCLPLSPIVSTHVCLSWMVRRPSRGLVSACLPLSPHMCACVGWCVRLPDVLSSLALADAPAFPRSCLPLSPSLPACVPALDAVSAFPGSCLRLSPIVRCVRLPEVLSLLVTRCFPLCVLRSPSRVLSPLASACGPSSPTCVPVLDGVPTFLPPLICHFFPHACLCWSTFPRSCFLLSPIFSPHVCL